MYKYERSQESGGKVGDKVEQFYNQRQTYPFTELGKYEEEIAYICGEGGGERRD